MQPSQNGGRLRQRSVRRRADSNDPPWDPLTIGNRRYSISATGGRSNNTVKRAVTGGGGSGNASGGPEICTHCGRGYQLRTSLLNHLKYECGKDPQFKCSECDYRSKLKGNIKGHMKRKHKVVYAKMVKDEVKGVGFPVV